MRQLPIAAPRSYTQPDYPPSDQEGECGFKARMALFIRTLPPHFVIESVRRWLPGEERFEVDWREQNRRIAAGEPHELVLTIRDTRRDTQ
jgi:hypothetical protein